MTQSPIRVLFVCHGNICRSTMAEFVLKDMVARRGLTEQFHIDYDAFDFIIGMDTANIRNMNWILGGDPDGKVLKLLEFAGTSRSVDDPWYTGDFETTYADVRDGCEGLLAYLGM